jgi:hypothetical protein
MKKDAYREMLFRQHDVSWDSLKTWHLELNKLFLWMLGLFGITLALYENNHHVLLPLMSIAGSLWIFFYRRASFYYSLNLQYLTLIREKINIVSDFKAYIYDLHHTKSASPWPVHQHTGIAHIAVFILFVLTLFLYFIKIKVSPVSSTLYYGDIMLWVFSMVVYIFTGWYPEHNVELDDDKEEFKEFINNMNQDS